MARIGRRNHIFYRPTFLAPLRQTTVENGNILVAHRPQHPPGARTRVNAHTVIDDEQISVAKPKFAHAAGELRTWRQHVGQGARFVGEIVDVEEYRARNMRGKIFRFRVAFCLGEIPGRVGDADVRRVDVLGQPFCRDQWRTDCH